MAKCWRLVDVADYDRQVTLFLNNKNFFFSLLDHLATLPLPKAKTPNARLDRLF